jgi:phosphotransferase family enzyme
VQTAISIAVDVARDHGLAVAEAIPLRSTNNAVTWLRPADVVAKVSREAHSRLLTELQVAQELVALGAPVVSPASEVPAVVHRCSGFEMTFWRYHAQLGTAEIPPDRVALALTGLHASLSRLSPSLKSSLPSYEQELRVVRSLLADRAALSALDPVDRDLLMTTFDRLQARLDELAPADRFVVLHGSPHSYNVLLANNEPAFIDFETTCSVRSSGTWRIWIPEPRPSSQLQSMQSSFGSVRVWSASRPRRCVRRRSTAATCASTLSITLHT